jgi:plastocyanin
LLQTGALPPGQAAGGEPGASPGASAPPGGGGSEGGGGEGSGGGDGQPAPSIPAADVTITAEGLKFLEPSFDAPADTPFTIAFVNLDPQTAHNVAIHEGSATGPAVFTGEVFNGVEVRVYDVDPIPAGTYPFICSVHPSMTGTANIQ